MFTLEIIDNPFRELKTLAAESVKDVHEQLASGVTQEEKVKFVTFNAKFENHWKSFLVFSIQYPC